MDKPTIRLRPLRRDDSALLYEWITDRELVLLNAPYAPVSEADHERWIESMMTGRPDLAFFVIELQVSGEAIGTCRLCNINPRARSAELQIRIGSTGHQGKGHGTDAVTALVEFGFKDLNLHRVYLHVFATNQRAIRAYEKSGFVREGVLRDAAFIDGDWVDVVLMANVKGRG